MYQSMEKMYMNLLYCFFSLFVFLIYPWGESYYYADAKAYYFMGFIYLLSLLFLSKECLRRKKLVWKWTKEDSLMVLFLCLIYISTLHAVKVTWVGVGTEHQGLLIILSCLFLFKLASRIKAVYLERLFTFINYSSLFAGIYSIMQYFHLAFLPQDQVYRLLFNNRTYSFFDNPDYFGSYLVLIIPLTIILYLLSHKKKQLLYLFILCLQFLSLIQSQTRSAWLGIVIGFFLISAWIIVRRRDLLKKWVFIILAAFLIFSISNVALHQKVLSRAVTITHDAKKIITNNNASSAGAGRWDIWQKTLPIIASHFWIGTGPNTFQQVFYSLDQKEIKPYMGTNNRIYDENNDYLQIALTMGVPALAVYLLLLLLILMKGIKKLEHSDQRQKLISIGMLAAIIGYLVQAFFNISVISVAPYFWLILGMFAGASNKTEI